MIITTKAIKQNDKTRKNAWPEFYTCNFLEPGLVDYSDAGAGMAMLTKETILKMLPTFMGKPVIDKRHKDVTEDDYEKHAVGYITKVWYDDYANWAYCQFMIKDDEARRSIAEGYSVSCAYDNVVCGKGGEWHAIKYDEEILDGVGNHLALVTSPRYEECKISPCMMLVNSKKATIKEGQGRKNTVTVRVCKNNVTRICDTCEYLERDLCSVAGPGGKITQRYANERINGHEMECSAYEKKKKENVSERRKNFVTVKVAKSK